MKYAKGLTYILVIIIFIVSSLEVKAEDVNLVSFESLLGSKFTSTTQGSFTNAGGSRKSSTYGIRISLVLLDDNNPVTKRVYDVFTSYDDNHNVNSKQNKLNTYTKYKSQTGNLKNLNVSVVTKTGENWNLDFRKIKEELANIKSKSERTVSKEMPTNTFITALTDTSYYKLIMELVDDNSSLKKEFECTTTNKENCSKANIKNYIDNVLNKIYILVEPISTVAFGSSNAWRGDIPLSDNEIKKIKDIGKFDSEYKNNDKGKLDELFIYLGLMDNAYFKDKLRPLYYLGICSSSDSAVCQSYAYGLNSYIRDWNKLVDQVNNISITYYTGTSTNIATKVLNSYNSDSTKKLRGISKKGNLQGSLEENVGRISEYFYGENININFPKFTKNTNTRSWEALTNQDYSLGIQILHGSFNVKITDIDMCSYEDGELSVPNGKDDEYCCNEMENDIPIWNDYNYKDGKSKQWQKFSKSDLYQEICPVEIEDNYCVWNGNNTERYQTINGNELDCCIYENWGNTNSERQTALKNMDKNNKVTKIVFENSDWYKDIAKCKVIVEEKCTIDKLLSGNHKECCEDINNWPISIKNTIREYGATTLKEYLIGYLGNDVYLSKCPINGCSYEITGQCPSCDDDLTNTGSIKDIVNGADSTELNISDETYKCIKNKASYLGSNDYLAISNSYCKVYCTEKIEYNFPKRSTLNVEAGRKLIVGGNLSPLETKSTVTCRIDKVDVDKFKSDINNLKVRLENAYREYAKSFYPESDKINEHKNYSSCSCIYKTEHFNCCKEETYKTSDPVRKEEDAVKFYYVGTGSKAQCQQVSLDREPYWIDGCSYEKGFGSDCEWVGDNSASGNPHAYIATWKCEKLRPMPLPEPQCEDGSYKLTSSKNKCYKYTCENSTEYIEYTRDAKLVTKEVSYKDSNGKEHYRYKYECSEYQDIDKEEFYLSEDEHNNGAYKNRCAVKKCKKATCSKVDNTKYSAYDTVSYEFFKVDNKNSEKYREGLKCATETNSTPLVPIYDSRRESALARLNSIKAEYNAKVQEIEDCGNFYTSEKTKPTYEIELLLDYQNANYSVNTKLSSSRTEERVDNFVNKTSIEVPTFNFNSYSWPKTLTFSTRTLNFDFDINKTQATKTTYTYTYSLSKYDNNAYQYINKSSVSEKQRSEVNSVYIGPHLPVAYNEKDNKIEVELTPVVVNNNIRKPRSGFENKLCIDPYKCDAVTPGKTKIVPVYRVIALDSPFPDEDGNGRLTGRNWCSGSDCSNTNPVVQKVITNNRGVNENEVYRLTPLYTLVLTPSTVKKIREYNSQTSYGDYNLICEKDTGKYCKSLYLRGEPDKEGNIIDNNLDQMGVLRRDKSCALNENLSGCMFGDYYERGA